VEVVEEALLQDLLVGKRILAEFPSCSVESSYTSLDGFAPRLQVLIDVSANLIVYVCVRVNWTQELKRDVLTGVWHVAFGEFHQTLNDLCTKSVRCFVVSTLVVVSLHLNVLRTGTRPS
jgi:hypothetical protein